MFNRRLVRNIRDRVTKDLERRMLVYLPGGFTIDPVGGFDPVNNSAIDVSASDNASGQIEGNRTRISIPCTFRELRGDSKVRRGLGNIEQSTIVAFCDSKFRDILKAGVRIVISDLDYEVYTDETGSMLIRDVRDPNHDLNRVEVTLVQKIV